MEINIIHDSPLKGQLWITIGLEKYGNPYEKKQLIL